MQVNEINRIIHQMNPWWAFNTGTYTYLPSGLHRIQFEELRSSIQHPEKAHILVGPRRVGKTTLLKQLISNLLYTKKINPKRILYASFDHPLLLLEDFLPFDKIFQVFEETLGERLEELTNPVFIFLDEIQKMDQWTNSVKHWLERKFPIHFILSGSSSLRILKGSGESLLGRTETKIIFPLSFKERLLWDFSWSPPNPLSLEYEALLSLYQKTLSTRKQDVQDSLGKHMLWGGYPELWEEKYQRQAANDEEKQNIIEQKQKLLNDYKSLTFERDIFELENVRDTVAIDGLFSLMAQSCSSKVNFGKYSSILGIKNDSVRRYCGLLESIYLTKMSYAYSKNQVVNSRKDKKNYFIDSGIRNAVLLLNSLNEIEQGVVAETLVANHLTQMAHHYSLNPKLFYWQESRKGEVDFIWPYSDVPIPIEVKFQNSIQKSDQYAVLYFMQKFKIPQGILITKNTLHLEKIDEKKILHIPLWIFLLIDQLH